jgi:type IV pilus assembly protein PilA
MKTFWKTLKRQDGFTLVELMVVVAIIGLLSAVAIPNFKKYQAKAKTSEAKLQLAAAYTAQQSFFSDFDTYAVCLAFMGYNPVNEVAQRIFAVGFASDTPTANIAAINTDLTNNGANGCSNTFAANNSIFAGGKALGGVAAVTTFVVANANTSINRQTFTVGAVGIVDTNFATAATAAAFTMDQAKRLVQVRAGY